MSEDPLRPHALLRALREAANLTLDDLGGLIDATAPSVLGWENGRDRPSVANTHILEAWARRVVTELRLPERRVLRSADWLTDEERAACERVANPEAA